MAQMKARYPEPTGAACQTWSMITVYGVVALTFMMLMYLFEKRGNPFVLAFAGGCALSSSYGFLSGAWPFGVVEGLWTFIALRRSWSPGDQRRPPRSGRAPAPSYSF